MTTTAEVRQEFVRAVKAADAAGLDVTGWALEDGAQSYGVAWRIVTVAPNGARHVVFTLSPNNTRAEAQLEGMGTAWWEIHHARKNGESK